MSDQITVTDIYVGTPLPVPEEMPECVPPLSTRYFTAGLTEESRARLVAAVPPQTGGSANE